MSNIESGDCVQYFSVHSLNSPSPTSRTDGRIHIRCRISLLLEQLQYPCTPSLCAALKTTRQALREGNYDVSLPGSSSGLYLGAAQQWQLERRGCHLEGTILYLYLPESCWPGEKRGVAGSSARARQRDRYSWELLSSIMCCTPLQERSLLRSKHVQLRLYLESHQFLLYHNQSATRVEHPSCAISHERKRPIVFRNYKQFQQNNTSHSTRQSDPSEPTSVEITSPKRLKTAIPLFNPSRRIPTTHCPSLEAFHQHDLSSFSLKFAPTKITRYTVPVVQHCSNVFFFPSSTPQLSYSVH